MFHKKYLFLDIYFWNIYFEITTYTNKSSKQKKDNILQNNRQVIPNNQSQITSIDFLGQSSISSTTEYTL